MTTASEELWLSDEQLSALSDEQRAEYLRLMQYRSALASPLGFAKYDDPTFPTHLPVLQLMDRYLVAAAEGRIQRLMLFLPPRTAKSELGIKKLVPWYLMRYPDRGVLISAYGATLARDHSHAARALVAEHPEFGITLDPTSKALDRWQLANSPGFVVATGVGGAIVGRGYSLAIIDDPVKGADDAYSARQRDRIDNWYTGTLSHRFQAARDGTPWSVVMIMTRWHEDDLAGRILSREGEFHPEFNPDGWTVVSVPAICKDPLTDLLGRKEGEPLQRIVDVSPERATREYAMELKTAGSRVFSALFQQSPTAEEGTFFKREHIHEFWTDLGVGDRQLYRLDDGRVASVDSARVFQTVDLAASLREHADFTVVGTWAVLEFPEGGSDRPALLLLDVRRARVEGPDHEDFVLSAHRQHNAQYTGIDTGSFGLTLIQMLQRKGVPIIPLENDGDKQARAITASVRMKAGDIFFRRDAPWRDDWDAELLSFPLSAHDDQVDVLSYAARELWEKGRLRARSPQAPDTPVTRHRAWVRSLLAGRDAPQAHPTLGKW